MTVESWPIVDISSCTSFVDTNLHIACSEGFWRIFGDAVRLLRGHWRLKRTFCWSRVRIDVSAVIFAEQAFFKQGYPIQRVFFNTTRSISTAKLGVSNSLGRMFWNPKIKFPVVNYREKVATWSCSTNANYDEGIDYSDRLVAAYTAAGLARAGVEAMWMTRITILSSFDDAPIEQLNAEIDVVFAFDANQESIIGTVFLVSRWIFTSAKDLIQGLPDEARSCGILFVTIERFRISRSYCRHVICFSPFEHNPLLSSAILSDFVTSLRRLSIN